jgi:uncharacterized protein with NAD-binding domain and iron-sulfur cluster
MSSVKKTITILGVDIADLTAAHELYKNGYDVQVLQYVQCMSRFS